MPKYCKLICGECGNDMAVWRADNENNDRKINPAELVFIESGTNRNRIRLLHLYPYIGRLPCRRGVISELKVGSITVRNTEISVFPDDSPLVEDCEGLLGMQYFQATVLALDFEQNLVWVKNR